MTNLKVFFLLATVIIVILIIIAVELTLVYNSISGVYVIESTGQLISFIIGVVSVEKTTNSIAINVIQKISRERIKHRMTLIYAAPGN